MQGSQIVLKAGCALHVLLENSDSEVHVYVVIAIGQLEVTTEVFVVTNATNGSMQYVLV